MPHRAWTPALLQNFQNSTRSERGGHFLYVWYGGGGGTGGTSKPGNKAWRSESPTLPGASRNLGIPTTGFRTCFPVHRKRGGRSYARRRTRGEVVRTRRSGEAEKAEEKVAARGGRGGRGGGWQSKRRSVRSKRWRTTTTRRMTKKKDEEQKEVEVEEDERDGRG